MIESLPAGGRAYIESHFVDMVRAIFSEVKGMNWNPDREASDLYIGSSNAIDDLETVPRIVVSVGDLAETGGAINGLKAYSSAESQFLFVDQGQVTIACYSEIEREASDMAYYVRRMMMVARPDLRKRGIFGIRNPQVSQGIPNFQGSIKDNLFSSMVSSIYMIPNRETIMQGLREPLFGGGEVIINETEVIVGTAYPFNWGNLPSPPAFTYATGSVVESEVQIHLYANHPVYPYIPLGFKLMRGTSEIECAVTKDPHNQFVFIVESPNSYLFGLQIVYDSSVGNVKSAATRELFDDFLIPVENIKNGKGALAYSSGGI